jgi:hypothetical protein
VHVCGFVELHIEIAWGCVGACIKSCEDTPLNNMGIDSTCVQFCEATHVTGLASGCTDISSLLPSPQRKIIFGIWCIRIFTQNIWMFV